MCFIWGMANPENVKNELVHLLRDPEAKMTACGFVRGTVAQAFDPEHVTCPRCPVAAEAQEQEETAQRKQAAADLKAMKARQAKAEKDDADPKALMRKAQALADEHAATMAKMQKLIDAS